MRILLATLLLIVTGSIIEAEIKCSKRTDFTRSPLGCPIYDIDNCKTPQIPPSCPIIEVTQRYPCIRFYCADDNLTLVSKENLNDSPYELLSRAEALFQSTKEALMETSTTKIDVTEIVDYLKTEIKAAKNDIDETSFLRWVEKKMNESSKASIGIIIVLSVLVLIILLILFFCCKFCAKCCFGSDCQDGEDSVRKADDQRPDSRSSSNGRSARSSSNPGCFGPDVNNFELEDLNLQDIDGNAFENCVPPVSRTTSTQSFLSCLPGPSNPGPSNRNALGVVAEFPEVVAIEMVETQTDNNYWREELMRPQASDDEARDPDYRLSNTEIRIPEVRRRSPRKFKPLNRLDL